MRLHLLVQWKRLAATSEQHEVEDILYGLAMRRGEATEARESRPAEAQPESRPAGPLAKPQGTVADEDSSDASLMKPRATRQMKPAAAIESLLEHKQWWRDSKIGQLEMNMG